MQGYDNSSYGDAFADVYDDWYGDITDAAIAVDTLARLSDKTGSLPIVELGIGTGRLALPLIERVRPTPVVGIDSSAAMLRELDRKVGGNEIRTVLGDMVDDLPDGPLGVVFVAFNTFFNLETRERQQACMTAVAKRLGAGGCFVVEAIVPDQPPLTGSRVEVKSLTADRVVLSVVRYDGEQVAEGQFVEFTQAGGVRLRPWSIRYVTPDELDAMAAMAGLRLRERWQSFAGEAFSDHSDRHVSVYELPPVARV